MRLAGSGLAGLSALVAGCTLFRGADAQTVAVCNRGFANDAEWTRVSARDPEPRALRRHFQSYGTPAPLAMEPTTTMWFKKPASGDFASCSKFACEDARCFWRVRLYAGNGSHWRVASEYHLAASKQP